MAFTDNPTRSDTLTIGWPAFTWLGSIITTTWRPSAPARATISRANGAG